MSVAIKLKPNPLTSVEGRRKFFEREIENQEKEGYYFVRPEQTKRFLQAMTFKISHEIFELQDKMYFLVNNSLILSKSGRARLKSYQLQETYLHDKQNILKNIAHRLYVLGDRNVVFGSYIIKGA